MILRKKPIITNIVPKFIKAEFSEIAPIKIRKRPRIAKYIGGAFNPYFLIKFKNPNVILFPIKVHFDYSDSLFRVSSLNKTAFGFGLG
jgi:hypothetical protein